VGLLKEEMRRMGSVVMAAADRTRVPAGKALAVDRTLFAQKVTEEITGLRGLRVVREEVRALDPERLTVMATGPLTSDDLAASLADRIGAGHLYFYDAIAPIVTADSVDRTVVFEASRYDDSGVGDYLNCPFTEAEYDRFFEALMAAEKTPARDFEQPRYFEGCLPIEVMAERGRQTLTFGPMKPVGLVDPRTGQRPFAVVQLRRENAAGTHYNLVGFQTRLRRPEQDRVFRLIPGLEKAEFARYGSVHRNTFIHAPQHLDEFLRLKRFPKVFLAGQVSGVEGYVESAAMGILAGENAARAALGRPLVTPPPTTALGGLAAHLTNAQVRRFEPSNVHFGLLPPAPPRMGKKARPAFYADRALADQAQWLREIGYDL
jgi:methylenetetrahydrofolate--tRNA-(uracil-5-)-methyltransferase